MRINSFTAAMSIAALQRGETRHIGTETSRKLAMAAGLTKSSDELSEAWEADPAIYLTTLKGAIAAYDQNKHIEEALMGCVARLVSVIDEKGAEVDVVVGRALEIVKGGDAAIAT